MGARGQTRTLLLLRHGQSAANSEDIFSGWLDVPLSDRGRRESVRAGELLAAHGPLPDVVHTSVLSRAIDTADIALAVLDRQWLPTRRSWRLNERHYGALQGRSRSAVRAEVGDAVFALWRRSYDHAPPPLAADDPPSARHDRRYAALPRRSVRRPHHPGRGARELAAGVVHAPGWAHPGGDLDGEHSHRSTAAL